MNIIEKLKQLNVEITPEVEKAFAGEFLSEKEVEKKLSKLQTENETLKQRAETAEEALKGFDGIDPAKIQAELDSWRQKAETAKADAEKQIYDRDYADALKTELESIKFTSEAAKRDVMAQITAAELKLRDGKILGLSDLLAQIRKSDESAFVNEQQEQLEQNKAKFTTSMNNQSGKVGTMTKDEIMAIKDRGERREAMLANKELFGLE